MSKEPKKKSRKRKDAEGAQEGDDSALEALKESPPPSPELTENVFIDRDYSIGLSTRFDESFPDILSRRVREIQFLLMYFGIFCLTDRDNNVPIGLECRS
jgi:hypothetical protein